MANGGEINLKKRRIDGHHNVLSENDFDAFAIEYLIIQDFPTVAELFTKPEDKS